MGVAGMVLGILSIIFVFVPIYGFVGSIIGIIGIILSALAGKKAKEEGRKDGLATAGLVLSIIGTVLSLALYIACIACASSTISGVNRLFP